MDELYVSGGFALSLFYSYSVEPEDLSGDRIFT
jgi:hypothetical protein